MYDFSKEFWKWITTDAHGTLNGVKEDAPQNIKDEYAKYVKAKEEAKKKHIKY